MKLMLDCQEVSRLISEGLDQTLDGPDRARMRLHFVMCQNCRNVQEQMAFMRRAMRALGARDVATDAATNAATDTTSDPRATPPAPHSPD